VGKAAYLDLERELITLVRPRYRVVGISYAGIILLVQMLSCVVDLGTHFPLRIGNPDMVGVRKWMIRTASSGGRFATYEEDDNNA